MCALRVGFELRGGWVSDQSFVWWGMCMCVCFWSVSGGCEFVLCRGSCRDFVWRQL